MSDREAALISTQSRRSSTPTGANFDVGIPAREVFVLGRQLSAFPLEKLHQRVGRFLRPFFQNPMTGVLQDDDRDIICDQLHLLRQLIA
jgi:hypothetical protein